MEEAVFRRGVNLFGVRVHWSVLLVFLALGYLTLTLGSFFTRIDAWYEALAKPSWTPPGWLIGLVWTILYTLIGLGSAIAWGGASDRATRRTYGWALGVNLVLNASWSALFFTLHEVGWAFGEILLLDASTLVLAMLAWARARPAGLMLAPYALWVLFASVLNFAIWRLGA